MPRRSSVYIALGLVAMLGAAALGRLAWLTRDPAVDLRISTGTVGGTYITLGGQLARILDEFGSERIGKVETLESGGSVQNARRLATGEADLSFVVEPVLAATEPREQLSVLLALYNNVTQILVRKHSGIKTLADLRGKPIFAGVPNSGTRWLTTRLLAAVELSESDYDRVSLNWAQVEAALRSKQIDAAFFITAMPVSRVVQALTSGCCRLLGLDDDLGRIVRDVPGVTYYEIPARTYPAQPEPVKSIASTVLLAARAELPAEVVTDVLEVFFDHLPTLAAASTRVQDIRIERGFENLSGVVPLHAGATEFRDRALGALPIATGSLNGRYYTLGKRMAEALARENIPTRILHTDGSLENLELLGADRYALAIVQYDVALASNYSPALRRKRKEEGARIPTIEGLRRIAVFHRESVHVLVRRDRLPDTLPKKPTVELLRGKRVSLGPPRSGTRVIAEALLRAHDAKPREVLLLSVPDTLARLNSGEIDAGFFVSVVPNQAVRSAVNDERNRLLSIDSRKVGSLLGAALTVSRIEPDTYGCQLPGEPAVDSISTLAVLITTEDLPYDVYAITRAVYEGAAYLGIEGGPKFMASRIESLPFHDDAEAYLKEAGVLLAHRTDWLRILWQLFGISVVLAGGYGGALRIWRDWKSNSIGKRILAIPVDPGTRGLVQKLIAILDEIPIRMQGPWWRFGKLDPDRWRQLRELARDRIHDRRENLTLHLAREIRAADSKEGMDDATRLAHLESIREDIWSYFDAGELDAAQETLLLKLIDDPGEGTEV